MPNGVPSVPVCCSGVCAASRLPVGGCGFVCVQWDYKVSKRLTETRPSDSADLEKPGDTFSVKDEKTALLHGNQCLLSASLLSRSFLTFPFPSPGLPAPNLTPPAFTR